MKLYDLKPAKGSIKKRKIIGRGVGSGHGIFSGRGCKGQKARAGYSRRPSFEGGRTPLYQQLPKKRGFKSLAGRPVVINVADLEKKFKDGDLVNKKKLMEIGLINSSDREFKILGDGELKKKIEVEVDYISKNAKKKIEKAGGSVKILEKIRKTIDLKKDKSKKKQN